MKSEAFLRIKEVLISDNRCKRRAKQTTSLYRCNVSVRHSTYGLAVLSPGFINLQETLPALPVPSDLQPILASLQAKLQPKAPAAAA